MAPRTELRRARLANGGKGLPPQSCAVSSRLLALMRSAKRKASASSLADDLRPPPAVAWLSSALCYAEHHLFAEIAMEAARSFVDFFADAPAASTDTSWASFVLPELYARLTPVARYSEVDVAINALLGFAKQVDENCRTTSHASRLPPSNEETGFAVALFQRRRELLAAVDPRVDWFKSRHICLLDLDILSLLDELVPESAQMEFPAAVQTIRSSAAFRITCKSAEAYPAFVAAIYKLSDLEVNGDVRAGDLRLLAALEAWNSCCRDAFSRNTVEAIGRVNLAASIPVSSFGTDARVFFLFNVIMGLGIAHRIQNLAPQERNLVTSLFSAPPGPSHNGDGLAMINNYVKNCLNGSFWTDGESGEAEPCTRFSPDASWAFIRKPFGLWLFVAGFAEWRRLAVDRIRRNDEPGGVDEVALEFLTRLRFPNEPWRLNLLRTSGDAREVVREIESFLGP